MSKNINLIDRLPAAAVRLMAVAMAPFENPTGTARPLWRDYARYQGLVNFELARLNGVFGFFNRATISWGYVDPFFSRNWTAGGDVGLYRSGYHVIYPAEDVERQLDNFYRVMPTIDILPRCIDLELDNGVPPARIAAQTWRMVELIERRDGIKPIIYSRYTLINNWLVPFWTVDQLNSVWYFLAQYLYSRVVEHPGEPTAPINVRRDRIVLHQTADKKPGFPGEVESYSVDYSRWEIGNAAQMHQWINDNWGGSPPVDPPIEPPAGSLPFRVLQDGLRLRSAPSTAGDPIGQLNAGDIVGASNVDGSDSWAFDPVRNGWVNIRYGNDRNMERIY